MTHTIQRHRDILHDYRQEFKRIRSNIDATLNRTQLLDSVEHDVSNFHMGIGSRMTRLMGNRDSIVNVDRLTQHVIGCVCFCLAFCGHLVFCLAD